MTEALPAPSWPSSLVALERDLQRDVTRPWLSRSLTAEERGFLASRRDLVAPWVAAAPDLDTAMRHVGVLLAALATRPLSEDEAKVRNYAFRQALEDVPAWAVQKACRDWNRGENIPEGSDPRWPPKPVELRRMAGAHLARAKWEIVRIDRLLNAPVDDPDRKPDPEKVARIKEMIAKVGNNAVEKNKISEEGI